MLSFNSLINATSIIPLISRYEHQNIVEQFVVSVRLPSVVIWEVWDMLEITPILYWQQYESWHNCLLT